MPRRRKNSSLYQSTIFDFIPTGKQLKIEDFCSDVIDCTANQIPVKPNPKPKTQKKLSWVAMMETK